jgi:hypothetical protein
VALAWHLMLVESTSSTASDYMERQEVSLPQITHLPINAMYRILYIEKLK